tara:strand:+ start:65 stop:496 length:432 start_codon:yes stop_codon:yes gene_type:complete
MKQKIKEIVESKTKIENISIRSRKQSIVEARVLYSTLCLKHTQDSYERIGKIINRDHSTIVHYKRIYNTWEQLPKMYFDNLTLLHEIDEIVSRIDKPIPPDADIISTYIHRNLNLTKQLSVLKTTIQKQKEKIDKLQHYEPVR